jgi:hypothetical protein
MASTIAPATHTLTEGNGWAIERLTAEELEATLRSWTYSLQPVRRYGETPEDVQRRVAEAAAWITALMERIVTLARQV